MSNITLRQVFKLLSQSRTGRVTEESLGRFLLNPDAAPGYTVSVDYMVTVDFSKSVEEMVDSGHYDLPHGGVTSKYFVVDGVGTIEVAVMLVYFRRKISTKDVLYFFKEGGLRPANVAELLAFGAAYPEVQLEFPILCLDPSKEDFRRVVRLCRARPDLRQIEIRSFDYCDWDEPCRFLAVRLRGAKSS
jgi:hypothetical protein